MDDSAYTPALGYRFLTPVYDFVVNHFTRENRWRAELAELVSPGPGDRILDVGCGTGSQIILIGRIEPRAELIGLDPDARVLGIAQKKAEAENVEATWIRGFLDEEAVARIGRVSKIVSSLVFHQTPTDVKTQILSAMRSLLDKDGQLLIADYGLQRTRLMRSLFRMTVQAIDGVVNTQPNADGCLPGLIESAGFYDVEERLVISTPTGSITLYHGIAE